MSIKILGISAFYHDSASALLIDGEIISAAQEERFTRIKHTEQFPENAIRYCLSEAGLEISDLNYIVFYEKPFITFERLLMTYLSYAPKGLSSFLKSMPVWLKNKLFLKNTIRKSLKKLSKKKDWEPNLLFTEHHQSHAASAFFPSPFEKASVLCLDGVGEWATTSAWEGEGNSIDPLWQIDFPHSLGLLYSAFTYYCGFRVNSGEYKLMGLAPYGEPKYYDQIKDNLIDIKDDGTFRLNMDYFNYPVGLSMTSDNFNNLFGDKPRKPETRITQKTMDLARSVQEVTEEVILKLVNGINKESGNENLCLAGGVALNCVANGKLLRNSNFKNIWIQPAAGDAGGALGAAYSAWYEYLGNVRKGSSSLDSMKGSYLGPEYSNEQITCYLDNINASYKYFDDADFYKKVTQYINDGKIIGWFQGRMEYGPRALGARSIIGDPRNEQMQSKMNLKIKYRESFRPFAPSIIEDHISDWFDMNKNSPYMLFVSDIKEDKKFKMDDSQKKLFGIDKLNIKRSEVPAVTHVDYSSRIQTVHRETNPKFYELINSFNKLTNCPILVNTSFNVRGEPIVCSPEDAYRCFMSTDMDCLVLENIILHKSDQPEFKGSDNHLDNFKLD